MRKEREKKIIIVDIVNKYLCVYYVDFFYLEIILFLHLFSVNVSFSHFRHFYLQKFIMVFIYSTFAVLLYVL